MGTQNLWNTPRDKNSLDLWGLANRVDHDDISKAISLKSSMIAGLTITNSGTGYTSAPTITIGPPDLPGGTQATADFTIVGSSLTLNLTNPGLGYSRAPIVTVTGGGGTGLTVAATVNYIVIQTFQLDPIPQNDMGTWNTNHQLLHQLMLNATAQQSSDLGDIQTGYLDFSDPEGMEEYIYFHAQDHISARNALIGFLPGV
jgi:hypothetical protein